MQEFMKADIFFFITSIAVVIATIGIVIIFYYVVGILRDVREVTKRVDEGTKAFSEDVSALRENFKREGFMWGHIFAFLKKHSRWFIKKPQSRRGSASDAGQTPDTH